MVKRDTVVSFAQVFPNSRAFQEMFNACMKLVEEAAAYLDGPGRIEAKNPDQEVALAYRTESIRLTTRLMQLASWMLLMRSVKEGETPLPRFYAEKVKISLVTASVHQDTDPNLLPEKLRELNDRSITLTNTLKKLNDIAYSETPATPAENGAHELLARLKREL